MTDFILKYSGILGILAAAYITYDLRKEPSQENPNPSNVGAYVAGIVMAVVWYYLIPYFIIIAVSCFAGYAAGVSIACAFFAPLLVIIAIVAFYCKSGKNVKIIVIGSIFFLSMISLLGVNNVTNTIVANVEDFNYCLTSKRMHDIRVELINPIAGTTEEEYNKLKEQHINLYNERKENLLKYQKSHQDLVNKDSLLQNFDHLTSSLFYTSFKAIRAEESVLSSGGSLEEALQAYERMK